MKFENNRNIHEKKPQIKTPRVAPLEGASTSTVAPVDVAHTYGSPPYVDIAGRYAPAGAYVSMHCGGHDADERRLIATYLRSSAVNSSKISEIMNHTITRV